MLPEDTHACQYLHEHLCQSLSGRSDHNDNWPSESQKPLSETQSELFPDSGASNPISMIWRSQPPLSPAIRYTITHVEESTKLKKDPVLTTVLIIQCASNVKTPLKIIMASVETGTWGKTVLFSSMECHTILWTEWILKKSIVILLQMHFVLILWRKFAFCLRGLWIIMPFFSH